jgi:hypothetical protein
MTKPRILPILCLAAILTCGCRRDASTELAIGAQRASTSASATSENDAKSPPQADALLVKAINTLDSLDSLSARLHLSVNLFGEQMVGSGIYLEQSPAKLRRLRLELNIQLRDQPATLLQVCDGNMYWTFRQQGEERSLTRVDVARVVAASAGPPGSASPGVLPGWPGIGGFPRLLRALRESFQFDAVESGHLLQVPVWRVQGVWRPNRLAELFPDQKKAIEQGKEIDLAKMPGQLPSHVVVFVGQEDLVPYRIEYRRAKKGRNLVGLESRATVVMAVQLSEVSLNSPLNPSCFVPHIGDMGSVDGTDEFLHTAGLR